jgi:hypothetical protein
METPDLPAIRALRPAWNKGRIAGKSADVRHARVSPDETDAVLVKLAQAKGGAA